MLAVSVSSQASRQGLKLTDAHILLISIDVRGGVRKGTIRSSMLALRCRPSLRVGFQTDPGALQDARRAVGRPPRQWEVPQAARNALGGFGLVEVAYPSKRAIRFRTSRAVEFFTEYPTASCTIGGGGLRNAGLPVLPWQTGLIAGTAIRRNGETLLQAWTCLARRGP